MVESPKSVNIWDLPTPLLRNIFVDHARILFDVLKELYQLDKRFGPILEASIAIITNDFNIPHQAMTALDGLEDLHFDTYDAANMQRNHSIQYCFAYFMVNPHLESFPGCFKTAPSILPMGYSTCLKIQVFNKLFREFASVRNGFFVQKMKMCNINLDRVFPNYYSNSREWNHFGFDNSNIKSSNIKTMSSKNLSSMKIELGKPFREHYKFEELSFPNLKSLIIEVPESPKDSLLELKNDEYRYYRGTSSEHLFKPTKQYYKYLSFKSCSFPTLDSFELSLNAKVECISNCDFPKLQKLEFNNNFLLLIENTNFKTLKKMVIYPTINLMEMNHRNLGLLKEDQFDIRGIDDTVKKFCEMYGVEKSEIKCFPSFIVKNVRFDSLKTLQVPHANSLLGFDDGFLIGNSIKPIIHPDPPMGYIPKPKGTKKRKTTS
ncbi:hypothetical protein BN7_3940 [Wickerhamomyces ciferrii]|uniref:Uncharacterized protein n=1 Tax=Wickerhamomyces ciferrii (strain ATCC 14091 / BCRC 22168 / CBS 111 / JCM 3599 / NBRC 0793 / NRRL Y-1031 F-60-10) TaxID=1206466 RepID=K0KQE9_WICCF|nr:uncharacterized protein BN7_3940 [Wickerhamomyces ciferrii]CCH44377.1 hypothetical protein BN7_3940 [Wickerhamomyces ciferrii]